jgi:rubrerythrin
MTEKKLTMRKVFELAISTEEMGAKYYEELAKKFAGEGELSATFAQLAKDETSHAAQFRQFLGDLPQDRAVEEQSEEHLLLRAAVSSQFFDKSFYDATSGVATPQDALARALAFERSTLFYYQSLKDVLGESPQLNGLIQAEKNHMTTLMRVTLSDAKFRGIADPW